MGCLAPQRPFAACTRKNIAGAKSNVISYSAPYSTAWRLISDSAAMAGCSSSVASNRLIVCDGCEFTIVKFIEYSQSEDNLNKFIYDHSVVPKTKKCPDCGSDMWLDTSRHMFRCKKRVTKLNSSKKKVSVQCDKSVSQFSGTWFEKTKLSLTTATRFVAFWCLAPPPRQFMFVNELELSSRTVVDWSNYLREVCFHFFCKNVQPIGGPGKVVEIDEAKIGKRKYNRGRVIDGNWIFGGIQRDTKQVFIVPVPTRGHETLLPIIKKYILPGTTVVSDCWRTYQCLQFQGFQHLTVNHSYNFIDPDTGAHTQTIERCWREVRAKVPRYGNLKHHFHGHIAEFLFKRRYSDYKTRIHHLWCAIGELYNGESSTTTEHSMSSSEYSQSD